MEPAVFLDRDNTLIANDADLGDPQAVRLLDGVAAGLRCLRQAGYRLVVVTNQGGVARGRFSEQDVDAVHRRIVEQAGVTADGQNLIERFYYCPYHPQGTVEEYRREHHWRKPSAGMLLQAARDLNLDLARSWMIGDQPRDVLAGQAAGCRTILIDPAGDTPQGNAATAVAGSFDDAVQCILKRSEPDGSVEADRASGALVAAAPSAGSEALRRAVLELTEELRTQRLRAAEFSTLRMVASLSQLLVLLLALLGLLQLGSADAFVRWTLAAALVQLFTIAALLADLKG